MEWSTPLKAVDGTPIAGADRLWRKGEVVRVDVMRREAGYGAAYGERRAGEWEFASYRADGRALEPAIDAAAWRPATASRGRRRFVFRGRFPATATN